ncbi:MAG: GTPase ObgE [Patescibacteria group bacterium]|nr:GTPase ObgE [Patescibacteria group bacterium]
MLIDEVRLKIKGGDGGNGVVSYKNAMMERGPTGGDGGKGGDVYLEGISDLSALRQFRHEKSFAAESGQDGSNRNKHGAAGRELVLKVPVGTVARNLDLKADYEVTKVGQKVLVAHGAAGGYGNAHFKSATNITPRQFSPGHKAREFNFLFELKLIADVGLIGLPNVGKSSLLNELTAARSKVANYKFTTLEPNLGVYYEIILADIPGLIEGASNGKGLGDKFLRHISRCSALFHLISCESENPVADYQTIREELRKFDPGLLEKIEYVFLSKSDLLSDKDLKKVRCGLEKIKIKAEPLSIVDDKTLARVKKILSRIAEGKRETAQS